MRDDRDTRLGVPDDDGVFGDACHQNPVPENELDIVVDVWLISYLLAAILTGAAGLIWGMASSRGQPTG